MKRYAKDGFTIIEVVLFLAVSGVFAVGLMAGMGAAIGAQQYRDAVQSYANFLRGQYSQVITVVNSRNDAEPCPLSNEIANRGQSKCVIVGRYVALTGDSSAGERYEVRPIYARQSSKVWQYGYGATDMTYETNWGARTMLASQGSGTARWSLVAWRNPDSGMVRIVAHSAPVTSSDITDFITDNSSLALEGDDSNDEICVRIDGFLAGQNQSVFVGHGAGSSDAIRVDNARACGQ